MAVNISGSVLSSLFYDQSSCPGDQVGFLLGEVVQLVKDTISDSQINNVEVETKLYVYECIPCPHDQKFFNLRGDLVEQHLTELLKDKRKNIIGWYSFRRNSTLRPSYRERLLHQNLCAAAPVDKNLFLLMLCSTKPSSNKSTHSFDHVFLQLPNNVFKRVPVSIINLGDTTHTEYRQLPSHTASRSQGLYSSTISQQERDFLDSSQQVDTRNIQSLNGAISRKLENISTDVIESEKRLGDLELEVQEYRKRVHLKLLEKQQREQNSKLATHNRKHTEASQAGSKKQPSVDELLFMDFVDSDNTGRDSGAVAMETVADTASTPSRVTTEKAGVATVISRDMLTSGGGCSLTKHVAKLTTPVILHSRSSSVPSDRLEVKLTSTVHTRSRSGDANNKSNTTGDNRNNADPFSFVSSMMEVTQKEESKNASSSKSSSSCHSPELRCKGFVSDPDSVNLSKKSVLHSSSNQVSNTAKVASQGFSRSSQSRTQRSLKGQGVGVNTVSRDSGSEMEIDKHNTEGKTKQLSSKTGVNTKHCSQEVGLKVTGPGGQEDTASSQDTYEMDVSSSPVY